MARYSNHKLVRLVFLIACVVAILIGTLSTVSPPARADEQTGATSTASTSSTDQPSYAEITSGALNGAYKFNWPIIIPNTQATGASTGITLDGMYSHLDDPHLNGHEISFYVASLDQGSKFFMNLALTLPKGDYSGKTITITLPRSPENTYPYKLSDSSDSEKPTLLSSTSSASQSLADCAVQSDGQSDGEKLICTFSGASSNLQAETTAVLTMPLSTNAVFYDYQREQGTPLQVNDAPKTTASTGEEADQLKGIRAQVPLVNSPQNTSCEFALITYGYHADDKDSQGKSCTDNKEFTGYGAVKKGDNQNSDYVANSTVNIWKMFFSYEVLNKNKNGHLPVIYENGGTDNSATESQGRPKDTVNADGTPKAPNDIKTVDLDYRVRLFPSAEHFTPRIRWTTRTGWMADVWRSLYGCVYVTQNADGTPHSPGWYQFDPVSSTKATVTTTACTPYTDGENQPDYTVGIQKGGHGFQIWFNKEGKEVKQMMAYAKVYRDTHNTESSNDFILEVYYETEPVDPDVRYTQTQDDNQKIANPTKETPANWALWNYFRLDYDDSTIEKNTGQYYSSVPKNKNTQHYSWGINRDGTPFTRHATYLEWVPQKEQNKDLSDGQKAQRATITLKIIDRAASLASGATASNSPTLDPTSTTNTGVGTDGSSQGLRRTFLSADAGKSYTAITSYNPLSRSGNADYQNPAWFQLSQVYSADTADESEVPLSQETDVVNHDTVYTSHATYTPAIHTDTNGELVLRLRPGTYVLRQLIAPAGYAMMPTGKIENKDVYSYRFTVLPAGENGAAVEVNGQQEQNTQALIPFNRIYARVRATPNTTNTTDTTSPFAVVVGTHKYRLQQQPTTYPSTTGYVTSTSAVVLTPRMSTGISAHQIQTACGSTSSGAQTDTCDKSSEYTLINVPWIDTGTDTVKDQTEHNDYKEATAKEVSAQYSTASPQTLALQQDKSSWGFQITRADIVNSPNTYNPNTFPGNEWDTKWKNPWAKIHPIMMSITPKAPEITEMPQTGGNMLWVLVGLFSIFLTAGISAALVFRKIVTNSKRF